MPDSSSAQLPPATDCHAHVFHSGLALALGRAYAPAYDATVEQYLELLERHGLGRGLLVQPSFLGTDNGFLLRALARHPGRLLGAVVVQEGASAGELAELAGLGVRGVRLNLVSGGGPDRIGELGERLAAAGLHLEIQATPRRWAELEPALRDCPAQVVVDHLGLPGRGGEDDGGAVERLAALPHVWVKVSAPYRSAPGAADTALRGLAAAAGTERMLWGSDWPWTRHEAGRDYAELLSWPATVLGAASAEGLLRGNPQRLLGG